MFRLLRDISTIVLPPPQFSDARSARIPAARAALCLALLIAIASLLLVQHAPPESAAAQQNNVTVSISAPDNANEGNSGTTNRYFTVSLSRSFSTEIACRYVHKWWNGD